MYNFQEQFAFGREMFDISKDSDDEGVAGSRKVETSTKVQEARHDPSRVASFNCVFVFSMFQSKHHNRFGSLCVDGQSYEQLM